MQWNCHACVVLVLGAVDLDSDLSARSDARRLQMLAPLRHAANTASLPTDAIVRARADRGQQAAQRAHFFSSSRHLAAPRGGNRSTGGRLRLVGHETLPAQIFGHDRRKQQEHRFGLRADLHTWVNVAWVSGGGRSSGRPALSLRRDAPLARVVCGVRAPGPPKSRRRCNPSYVPTRSRATR